MLMRAAILLFLTSLRRVAGAPGECVNVETSEGLRTLQHGQKACAPLASGEYLSDKGKSFVTCSQGRVSTQSCSSDLRYDTAYNTCTWRESATCRLDEEVAQATSTTLPKPVDITVNDQTSAIPQETPINNSNDSVQAETSTTSTTRIFTTRAQLTGSCNSDSCKLPDCFCYGSSPKMTLSDTPMFIMLTFDDAVTPTLYSSFFKSLLVDNTYKILNPNGCPMRTAFYINHDYTDYSLVKSLADNGHEIASHTVNHTLPPGVSSADYPEAVAEIAGMRDKVAEGTGNKTISDGMVGVRAPYLRVAYDIQFDAIRDSGFMYDTSITNIETSSGRDPLWPFTLDYVMPQCSNVPCPSKPYPGIWEVPINGWVGSNGYGCSMIDTCSVGTNVFTASEQEWYEFYKRNFDRYFYQVKVPMHLFTHGSMFLRSPSSYPALISWFQDLQLTHNDVWFVSPKMVIEWMKNPITNSQMITNKWGC